MKRPLLLSVLGTAIVGLMGTAQAGVTIKVNHGTKGYGASGYHGGGHALGYITQRIICGYDRYRRPIYRTVRVPQRKFTNSHATRNGQGRKVSRGQVSNARLARR